MPPAAPTSTDPAGPSDDAHRASTASRPPVLGLGGTVDYVVDFDEQTVQALVDRHGITAGELHRYAPIEDERSLLVCLLAFVATGTGGERFVASPQVVGAFAAHFPTRVELGGTCVRAALALDRLGLPSLVHLVSIDDDVRRLLPPGVAHLCSAPADSTDPHLIVQFGAGSGVTLSGTRITAAHPDRVILANDVPNELLVLSDDLDEAVVDAPVFLLSGFNTMKNADLVTERLDRLRRMVRRMRSTAVVIYEDGGFHDRAVGAQVRAGVAELVDVFSMNENEWQGHLGRTVDLLDARDVRRALRDVREVIPARVLVVHTKFWSAAVGRDAARWAPVLRGGITLASTRFRHGDVFTAADHDQVAAGPPHPAGAAFAHTLLTGGGTDLWCEPALQLDVVRPHTVGLGDSFVAGMVAALVSAAPPAAEAAPGRR